MADICTGLRTYLLTKSAITDLVGTTGIYFDVLPESIGMSSLPKIVLNQVTSEHYQHLTDVAGLVQARVQVDCYAQTRTEANSLADAVRTATAHYAGSMGSETVRHVSVESMVDGEDAPIDGSQQFRRIRSVDLLVTHAETVPGN